MKTRLTAITAFIAFIAILLSIANYALADTTFVCVVRQDEWVWVRSAPSPNAEKIEKLKYGYEVNVSEIVNGYAHINWVKGEGWADASYLELPAKEEIYVVNTADGPLAKRETPDGRLMCWIKKGSRISVLGWRYSKTGELWAKVWHGGYCKAEFLAKVE